MPIFNGLDSIIGTVAGYALSRGKSAEGPNLRNVQHTHFYDVTKIESNISSMYQQGILPVLDLTPAHIMELKTLTNQGKIGFNTQFSESIDEIVQNFKDKPVYSKEDKADLTKNLMDSFSYAMLHQKAENVPQQIIARVEFYNALAKLPREEVSDDLLKKFKPNYDDNRFYAFRRGDQRNTELDNVTAQAGNLSDSICINVNALKTVVGEFNPLDALTKNVMAFYTTSKDAALKLSSSWPTGASPAEQEEFMRNMPIKELIEKSTVYQNLEPSDQKKVLEYVTEKSNGIDASFGNFAADVLTKELGDGRSTSTITTSIDAVKGSYGKSFAELQVATFANVENQLTDRFITFLIKAYEEDAELPFVQKYGVEVAPNGKQVAVVKEFYRAREVFDSKEFWEEQNDVFKIYGAKFNITHTFNPETQEYEIAPGVSKEKVWEIKRLVGYTAPSDLDGFRHYANTSNAWIDMQRAIGENGGIMTEGYVNLPKVTSFEEDYKGQPINRVFTHGKDGKPLKKDENGNPILKDENGNSLVFDKDKHGKPLKKDSSGNLILKDANDNYLIRNTGEENKADPVWQIECVTKDDMKIKIATLGNTGILPIPNMDSERFLRSKPNLFFVHGEDRASLKKPSKLEIEAFDPKPDPEISTIEVLTKATKHFNTLIYVQNHIPTEPQSVFRPEVARAFSDGAGAIASGGVKTAGNTITNALGKVATKAVTSATYFNESALETNRADLGGKVEGGTVNIAKVLLKGSTTLIAAPGVLGRKALGGKILGAVMGYVILGGGAYMGNNAMRSEAQQLSQDELSAIVNAISESQTGHGRILDHDTLITRGPGTQLLLNGAMFELKAGSYNPLTSDDLTINIPAGSTIIEGGTKTKKIVGAYNEEKDITVKGSRFGDIEESIKPKIDGIEKVKTVLEEKEKSWQEKVNQQKVEQQNQLNANDSTLTK